MSQRKEIVHFLGTMDLGGTERWLIDVLRNIDREKFHFTFCTARRGPMFFDREIQSLGAVRVICPVDEGYRRFARRFISILKETKCEVVHCHSMFFCGVVMRLAKKAGVPVRIAHAHSSDDLKGNSVQRFAYRCLMRHWIKKYATNGIGCSTPAADYLFTGGWRNRSGYQVMTCAIDIDRFRRPVQRQRLLNEFNIRPDVKIIGHIGGFRSVKNHEFLLCVAAEIRKHTDIHLLLVGDGTLRGQIERSARQLGMIKDVTFAGVRDDVPQLLNGLFDLIIFPSRFEGLPLVVVESQAAGVPCLISDVITLEATVIDELVHRMSLQVEAQQWAKRAVEILNQKRYDKAKAIEQLENGTFSIASNVRILTDLYPGRLPKKV